MVVEAVYSFEAFRRKRLRINFYSGLPCLERRDTNRIIGRGVRKLMGVNLTLVWAEFFNYKLGCFDDVRVHGRMPTCIVKNSTQV
jgi:hypothetical protein